MAAGVVAAASRFDIPGRNDDAVAFEAGIRAQRREILAERDDRALVVARRAARGAFWSRLPQCRSGGIAAPGCYPAPGQVPGVGFVLTPDDAISAIRAEQIAGV